MRTLKTMALVITVLAAASLLGGCIIPRVIGSTVKGVAVGTVKVVEGTAKVVTSPL